MFLQIIYLYHFFHQTLYKVWITPTCKWNFKFIVRKKRKKLCNYLKYTLITPLKANKTVAFVHHNS